MNEIDQITQTMYVLMVQDRFTEDELRKEVCREKGYIVHQDLYQKAMEDLSTIIGRDDEGKLYVL